MKKAHLIRILGVMKALLRGNKVTIKDTTYVMSDDYELCTVATKVQFGSKKVTECYLRTGLQLKPFVNMIGAMSEEDYIGVAYMNAMQHDVE